MGCVSLQLFYCVSVQVHRCHVSNQRSPAASGLALSEQSMNGTMPDRLALLVASSKSDVCPAGRTWPASSAAWHWQRMRHARPRRPPWSTQTWPRLSVRGLWLRARRPRRLAGTCSPPGECPPQSWGAHWWAVGCLVRSTCRWERQQQPSVCQSCIDRGRHRAESSRCQAAGQWTRQGGLCWGKGHEKAAEAEEAAVEGSPATVQAMS